MTSQSTPSRLGIIVSSARPNRIADVVSQWVRESVPAEVTIDLIDLAFTAGIDGGAWVRLIFAVVLIAVMNRDDVRAYFDGGPTAVTPAGKPGRGDDWS